MTDSRQSRSEQSRRKVVTIVEEVPGVPKAERYFIRYRRRLHHFPSLGAAKRWCSRRGQPYNVESFRP